MAVTEDGCVANGQLQKEITTFQCDSIFNSNRLGQNVFIHATVSFLTQVLTRIAAANWNQKPPIYFEYEKCLPKKKLIPYGLAGELYSGKKISCKFDIKIVLV